MGRGPMVKNSCFKPTSNLKKGMIDHIISRVYIKGSTE